MKTKTAINIPQVLEYQHEETVLRFMDEFDISDEEANDVFREMKLFLCLLAKYPNDYIFTHEPLWIIDEMWHTFLLYSQDYYDFCLKYFGKMIHHAPTPRAKKLDIIERLKTDKAEIEKMLKPVVKNLYEKIYDYLGPDTLIKWLEVYGNKYTIEYMNKIRKPIQ